MDSVSYRSSATTSHFKKITKILYLFTATNFWFEDLDLPRVVVRYNKYIWKFLDFIIIASVLTEVGALYTQNLTAKETTDVMTDTILHLYSFVLYGITLYHKDRIRELLLTLTVTVKEMFNDEKVERMMIRRNHLFLPGLVLVCFCPAMAFGIQAAVHSFTSNATFTIVIPIWPDLEDRSLVAGVARVIIYIAWMALVSHVISGYTIIVTISICLRHQFSNLYEYFLSLNDIFNGDESIEEQEKKYENAVKDGVKMHCITLNCVNQLQVTGQVAFSGQVVIIVSAMVLLMILMMQTERTLLNLAPIVMMGVAILLNSAFIIWSAADITFEAERLPTAIFHSGWHNCRGKSSVRMRKTITIAIAAAQRPVVITGLGIMEMSYESYVAVVKAGYSVFSLFY